MKIAIVYKWARDPEAAIVRSDGSVDYRGAKMTAGEDDHAALSAAKTIVEGLGGDLIGLSMGDGDASWALARGVKETYSVSDAPNLADQVLSGKILAAAVSKISNIDVVVIGDAQAYPAVAASLAAALGYEAVMGITDVKVENGKIIATRTLGSQEQSIAVNAPVVLGVVAQSEEKGAPGMKEMLMARKRQVGVISLAELGVNTQERLSLKSSREPQIKHAKLFDGSADEAASKLLEALKKEGVL